MKCIEKNAEWETNKIKEKIMKKKLTAIGMAAFMAVGMFDCTSTVNAKSWTITGGTEIKYTREMSLSKHNASTFFKLNSLSDSQTMGVKVKAWYTKNGKSQKKVSQHESNDRIHSIYTSVGDADFSFNSAEYSATLNGNKLETISKS